MRRKGAESPGRSLSLADITGLIHRGLNSNVEQTETQRAAVTHTASASHSGPRVICSSSGTTGSNPLTSSRQPPWTAAAGRC